MPCESLYSAAAMATELDHLILVVNDDSFHAVGNNVGPGDETGARGMGKAVYFFDPDKHLVEIRHYEG